MPLNGGPQFETSAIIQPATSTRGLKVITINPGHDRWSSQATWPNDHVSMSLTNE